MEISSYGRQGGMGISPMCPDMGSACYSTLCRIVSDTTILQYSCVQYSCVEELVELLA